MYGIVEMLRALEHLLPLPVVIGIAVALGVVGVPVWFESVRAKQIRGRVRRMIRAEPAERQKLADEAFGLAAGRARRLQTLAEAAAKYDQRALRNAAVEAWRSAGGDPRDIQRIRELDRKPPPKVVDPTAAAVRVEQLLDEGLHVAAAEHLDQALRAFPDDPELRALRDRLEGARTATTSLV